MKLKRWQLLSVIFAILLIFAGCSQEKAENKQSDRSQPKTKEESTKTISFQDSTGEKIVLKETPKRVVLLNTQLYEIFNDLGGKPVGISTVPELKIPENAKAAKQLGMINDINLEETLKLKPDLVIGQSVFHGKLKEAMYSSNIPLALTAINSVNDVRENAEILGKILDKEKATAEKIKQMDQRIQRVLEKAPDKQVTYAVITMMMDTVSLQTDRSIALDIANSFKMKNIAESLKEKDSKGMGSVPFSMETLVNEDPDYVFLIVHGSKEEGQRMLKDNLESNQAWSSLSAIKKNQFRFIPGELFVNNPGLSMEKSFEYMGKAVYPEVYGKLPE
ncbi:ABC transporter substrate-binding protein [Fictibacillus sp. 7GRE50]|uniref:ABC transporter substrate-binding protein n=1 Tax=unclassified Fictibacillus TaxID=2644029 RepID=UPI0018CE6AFD|nr:MULTISPECIES: ABC transporter substrate-binding protein [unclassified Fictibacillus]MBH0166878.1 ABC transporter substrate-binding protein [Fictibacillus sp. 7GRE50]MBH0173500.1 ABC transporter substrate-binding protein [Fictibacillus sp. 23RED33]